MRRASPARRTLTAPTVSAWAGGRRRRSGMCPAWSGSQPRRAHIRGRCGRCCGGPRRSLPGRVAGAPLRHGRSGAGDVRHPSFRTGSPLDRARSVTPSGAGGHSHHTTFPTPPGRGKCPHPVARASTRSSPRPHPAVGPGCRGTGGRSLASCTSMRSRVAFTSKETQSSRPGMPEWRTAFTGFGRPPEH